MKKALLVLGWVMLLTVSLYGEGLVISCGGTVQLLRKDAHTWIDVDKGQKLLAGDRLKSSAQSYAQVIFNGMLRNLPEKSELVLSEESIELNEFFDSLKLKKRIIPAARDDATHEHWIRLVTKNRLSFDDIDVTLELIDHYASLKIYGRMLSLIIKLDESLPELNFRPILDAARQRYRMPIRWVILKYQQGERTPIEADLLTAGDLFQIGYRVDDESYLYLVATDRIDSTIIYPQEGDGRLSPGTLLLIPGKEAIVAQNNTVFWALSCYGPVEIDAKLLWQVDEIFETRNLELEDIATISPSLCRPTIFFEL